MKAESFKYNQKLKGIYIYKLKERERENVCQPKPTIIMIMIHICLERRILDQLRYTYIYLFKRF